jgi:signal transduction histidine kinase/ActR/RegA family two-component response regulator
MSSTNDNFFLYRDFLYRDVIECMTSGVAAFWAERDPVSGEIVDFRWVLQNAYASKVTGRPEAELIGKRLLEELPEHGPSGLFERYRQVVETGEQHEFTVEYHDGGVNGVFSVRAVKMGDGFAVAFTDVTEEVERRRAHETVAGRLALATRAAGIGMWEFDIATDRITWDETTSRMLGHAPEVAPSYELWKAAVHPEDLSEVRRAVLIAREQGRAGESASFGVRYRIVRTDGVTRHIQSHAQLVASVHGGQLVGVHWDVTEETERRQAFETLANRFLVATRSAGIGVWEQNLKTGARMWDEATYRILGRDPRDPATSENWKAAVHPEDIDEVRRIVDAARASDPSSPEANLAVRFRIIHSDGSTHHVQSHAQLVDSEEGRRLVGVNWDITDQVAASRELEVKRREAEAANIAKSQFLAVMSHEIRTPLNGVLGMAALLGSSDLTDRQRRMLDTIRESGDELLEILNSILDLSRIEAGRVEIEETEFNLDQLVRRAATLFEPQANDKGVAFRVEASRRAHGALIGDSTRIRQVLLNLLSNAVKFTASGEIVLSSDVVASPDGVSHELVFAVRDTGVGIPEDKLARIFEPFTQADGSTTRRFGGAGLGLSVAAQVAEILGGSIAVESAVGAGSTFTVRLPVARAMIVRTPDPPAPALVAPPSAQESQATSLETTRLRVLAAEDSPTNQLVLGGLLRAAGIEATLVENGLKAIEAWACAEFDLILLDIQMPVMDGVAAAKEIRRLEAETDRARTPIVAVSANAMTHQVESYLAAGMDAHLAKPVKPADLVAAIEHHVAKASRSGAGRPTARRVGGGGGWT